MTAGKDYTAPLMTRNAFTRGLVSPEGFGLDLDEGFVSSQFYEVVGYPDNDEEQDNGDEDSGRSMTEGEFATGLARVANQVDLMLGGALESNETFASQLYSFVAKGAKKVLVGGGFDSAELRLLDAKGVPRSPETFGPPKAFVGTPVICYLDVSIDGEAPGRIEIELDTSTCPKTSYNFMKLCCPASSAAVGELTKMPLSFEKSVFHRVVSLFINFSYAPFNRPRRSSARHSQ